MGLDRDKHSVLVKALGTQGMQIDAMTLEFIARLAKEVKLKGKDISIAEIEKVREELNKEVMALEESEAKN